MTAGRPACAARPTSSAWAAWSGSRNAPGHGRSTSTPSTAHPLAAPALPPRVLPSGTSITSAADWAEGPFAWPRRPKWSSLPPYRSGHRVVAFTRGGRTPHHLSPGCLCFPGIGIFPPPTPVQRPLLTIYKKGPRGGGLPSSPCAPPPLFGVVRATTPPRWTTSPSGPASPSRCSTSTSPASSSSTSPCSTSRATRSSRCRKALASTEDNKQRVAATMQVFYDYVANAHGAFRLVFESDLNNEPAVRERVDRVTRDAPT